MKHPEVSRVIVTRNKNDGTSDYEVLSMKADTPLNEAGNPVFTVSQLWGTPDGIPQVGTGVNPAQVVEPWFPGPGGVRFRFFTFLPLRLEEKTEGHAEPVLLESAHGDGLSNFGTAFDPDRPGMHISDSVDFVFVMSGEVVMELERRAILVKQGDIVIMRGGWHNWRNETDQPCTVASVMVGAHRVTP